MLKIALVTNFNISEKADAAMAVARVLAERECEILIATFYRDKILRTGRHMSIFRYVPSETLYAEASVILVLGGDGTILDAARHAAVRGTPILGINLGRLGYMAELELSELHLLEKIFGGDYRIEKRSMLRVELLNVGRELRSFCYALNDAVVSGGAVSRMIDLELSENGTSVTDYRADGMIIATPTGSTAYSMSAGGAVVDPRVPCICVTPVCSHSLVARPLIFSDASTLEIRNTSVREKMLYLTVDGRIHFEVYRNQIVRVTKASMQTRLIRLKNGSFYKTLRQKMQVT